MQTSIVLAVGGLFLLATVVGQVLEHAGKPHHSRMLDLVAVMVGLTVIIGLLGTLFGEINSVFHIF